MTKIKITGSKSGRKQRFNDEERKKIVEETRQPGNSVPSVAIRHGVSASQVYTWRARFADDIGPTLTSRDQTSSPEFDALLIKIGELERTNGRQAKEEEARKRSILINSEILDAIGRYLKALVR